MRKRQRKKLWKKHHISAYNAHMDYVPHRGRMYVIGGIDLLRQTYRLRPAGPPPYSLWL